MFKPQPTSPKKTTCHFLTPVALACLSLAAVAQDTSGAVSAVEPKDQALNTVVITGIRSTNAKSIAAKRDSALVIDSVAADDIGKLPDFNVGDALKRVTGVTTLSYQGEPRFVIIRGLNANYNTTLIDGFSFATADVGSRQVLMEVLPSNFVQRIDVTKSFLPESDGGAMGGIANLVTANAFSYPDNSFTFSAKAGQNLAGQQFGGNRPVGEGSARWAKRFGEANEFGLLTTASYWSRAINVPQIETGGTLNGYNAAGVRQASPYAGNGIAVPTERRWYNYDNQRQRAGLTTRLDWQPDGKLSGHVAGYYFKQHETSDRATQIAAVNTTATVSNPTATSGTLSSVNDIVELARLRWDRALYGVNGELKYEFSPLWSADVRASSSRSTVSNPQTFDRFTQSNQAYNYDWSGATPVFTPVNMANANNPALYGLTYHRPENTQYSARVNDVQVNTKYNAEDDSRGLGLVAGARSVVTHTNTSFSRVSYSAAPYTLANVRDSAMLCGFNCSSPLLLVNGNAADTLFNQYLGTSTATTDTAAQFGGTYGIQEEVSAAYAQAQFKTNEGQVAGGLRFEHTRTQTQGFLSTNGVFAPVTTDKRYSNVLPSVAASYNTSEASKLRAGLSQSLGRPRFDQMATRGGVLSTSSNPPTLSQGNAELKPRRGNNLDVGHDWYLDGGRGIFSVGLFHKQISDEIFNFGQTQTLNVGGVPTSVLVTQARNVSDKVKLTGLELGLTKDLDFLSPALKGFGITANATFTRASYPVKLTDGSTTTLSVLPQQPKRSANVAVYYEQGPVHAKLAWNYVGKLWDDRFPNYTALGFYANRYQQPTKNIDVQLSYDISKQLSVSLDVLNLTEEGLQYNFGRNQEYVQSAWKLRPTVLVGLNYKL